MKNLPPLAAALCALSACSNSTTDTASLASALQVAQTDYCADRAAGDACRQTYDACVTTAAGDATATQACVDALHACLPPPPHAGREGDGCLGGMDDGGVRPGRGGPGGDGDHGPGERGPSAHRGAGPQPDQAVVQACHDAEQACLTAAPADPTCVETERQCVHDAFAAAFAAACADAQTTCTDASTPECADILARCAAGIGAPPGDGGTCGLAAD